MAGETPGKSGQRRSSGATSGKARDPRLEMTAEREAADAAEDVDADERVRGSAAPANGVASGEDAPPARRDSNTIVLPGARDADDGGAEDGAEGGAEAGSGSGSGPEAGSDAEVGSDSEASSDSGPDARSDSGSDSGSEAGADSGSGSEADRVEAGAAGTGADEAGSDAGAGVGTPTRDKKTAAFRVAEPEPDNERLRAAVAAWVAQAGDKDDETDADATDDTANGSADAGTPVRPITALTRAFRPASAGSAESAEPEDAESAAPTKGEKSEPEAAEAEPEPEPERQDAVEAATAAAAEDASPAADAQAEPAVEIAAEDETPATVTEVEPELEAATEDVTPAADAQVEPKLEDVAPAADIKPEDAAPAADAKAASAGAAAAAKADEEPEPAQPATTDTPTTAFRATDLVEDEKKHEAAGDEPKADSKPQRRDADTAKSAAAEAPADKSDDAASGTDKSADKDAEAPPALPTRTAAATAADAKKPGKDQPAAAPEDDAATDKPAPAAATDKPAATDKRPAAKPAANEPAAQAPAAGKPAATQPAANESAAQKAGQPPAAKPAADKTSVAKPATPPAPPAPPAGLPPRPTAAPTAGAAAASAASPAGGAAPAAPGEAAPPAGDSALPAYEQTKQQPLPPYEEKRPLDLLAQLTNTPPPAETPVRTIVRRFKIWTPLVALLVVVLGVIQLVRPLPEPTLSLTAKESYAFKGGAPEMPWPGEGQAVVEVEGLGRIGESGKEKPVPIASVAKVMTAYLMLKEHPVKGKDDGELIPMDQQAEDDAAKGAQGESVVNVDKGDKLSQREALQAIMVASANNVARQIARWDAGSEKAFVKKMNDTAKELGMTNTTYTDPSGLNATTVSTASDQVKLGMEAMKDPLFREVVLQPQYKDSNGDSHQNYNRLVPVNGVRGIKTGTTTKAGGNFVFAAEKKVGGTTQRIVGAVFGQHEAPIIDTVMARGQELITAAQGILTDMRVVKKGDVVGYVDDGLGTQVPVVATKDVNAVGWSGLKVSLKIGDGGKTIPNAAEAGDKIGELTMGGGQGEVSVPVALKEDLKEPGAGAKLTRLG